jgi:hypothetical protein
MGSGGGEGDVGRLFCHLQLIELGRACSPMCVCSPRP